MTRLRADLMLLACAAIWGFGFAFHKSVMDHLDVFRFMVARSVIAVVALAPFVFRKKQQSTEPLPTLFWRSAMLGAGAFTLGTILQQIGIKTASVKNTGFLTSMYIVFTPVVTCLISRKAPPPVVLPAIVLSKAGAWSLMGGTLEVMGRGEALIAASALCWATHTALMGYGAVAEKPMTLPFMQFVTMGFAAVPVALLFEHPSYDAHIQALPALLYSKRCPGPTFPGRVSAAMLPVHEAGSI